MGTSGNFVLKTIKATGVDKKTKTYTISLNDTNNLYKITNTDDNLTDIITPTIEILKEDTLIFDYTNITIVLLCPESPHYFVKILIKS